jgi:hypothetical protein
MKSIVEIQGSEASRGELFYSKCASGQIDRENVVIIVSRGWWCRRCSIHSYEPI